ncbi:calcium-binding protein [Sulfitobacter sp. JB4-11]|uniref:calcium-binding protein n=1 Tax=Sulfitobacter rhodophyticola TaxID=3238304 RepID=UPI003517ED2C
MPQVTPPGLQAIADLVRSDPGLKANIGPADIEGGAAAAELMNGVITTAITALGVNADNKITPDELRSISDYIRADTALYDTFVEGHGDDEGNEETGFHLAQGDGGAYQFQGRNFIDTVADAIYHVGFEYRDGRFRNEDGNENEAVDDVAGWLNYFLNGENRVYGTDGSETLHSGQYSFDLEEANHEIFEAGGGDDSVWAGIGNDTVFGGAGNDVAGGDLGNDVMHGEGGNDSLWGDEGNDILMGEDGNDNLGGGTGNDEAYGGVGLDTIWGEEGQDLIKAGNDDDVAGGGIGRDTVRGQDGDDRVHGNEGNDLVDGGTGDDFVSGGMGADTLLGGLGNDTIYGEDGKDLMKGHDGADLMGGGKGEDTMSGGQGDDTLYGEEGRDMLKAGQGRDTASGGAGDDTVLGGSGDDKLIGGTGADLIKGQAGNDELFGEDGKDVMQGNAGNDTLTGGEGVDRMIGGTGADLMLDWEDTDAADIFVFHAGDSGVGEAARDEVRGFDSGIDRIDLSSYGGLRFEGDGSFAGGGQASVMFADNLVQIDADGNGAADAEIFLTWVNEVQQGDFIL